MLAIGALCLVPLLCETSALDVLIIQVLLFCLSILYFFLVWGLFCGCWSGVISLFSDTNCKRFNFAAPFVFWKVHCGSGEMIRHENQRIAKDGD